MIQRDLGALYLASLDGEVAKPRYDTRILSYNNMDTIKTQNTSVHTGNPHMVLS